VRQREDVDNVRVLSVDEEPGGVDKRSVDVLNNDEQLFTSRISRRRLRHNHRLVTPAQGHGVHCAISVMKS